MSLLSLEGRKRRFEALGLEYNEAGIRKLQKKYMRKSDVDGKYGTDTDRVLRHVYNVKKCAPSFDPTEFRCTCGHCTGYPSYMKQVELKHLQRIRDHYKKPMIVTSGLRCKHANSSSAGSIQNSLHLVGRACDFYMAGVTDTLANRKKSIKWIRQLPNHHYTYGNGYNSNGYSVYAPYMGNALHTDTNKAAKTVKKVTITTKEIEACKAQAKWMRNYRYAWESFPTVPKSRKKGTCVTFVACVLQRIGILKSGQYIWHDEHGKVTHANDKMKVIYPKNQTLKSYKSKLKRGDIVMAGKASDVGAGSHIFIITGKWKGTNPYIYDNHSAERVKRGAKTGVHTYSGSKKIIAVVRLK